MNKNVLSIPLVLSGLSLGLLLAPAEVHAQYRSGSFTTVQHGYEHGYREGYRIGAQEGYNGARTGLERTFGDRDEPAASVYRERHWGYQDVAADVGYREGVGAGLKDFRERHSYKPQEHDAWKDADHGYDKAFGNKTDYKRAYRLAFENGYRDGFGTR
jgi:hypothetical protein